MMKICIIIAIIQLTATVCLVFAGLETVQVSFDDNKLTIRAAPRFAIPLMELLTEELKSAYIKSKKLDQETELEGGFRPVDDDIVVESNKVIYRDGLEEIKTNDVRIISMDEEIEDWIKVQTQELSFTLSSLLNELYVPKKQTGEALGAHILFLNTYMELLQISRAQLPFINWMSRKLISLDKIVASSLKYLNDWVDWTAKQLDFLESRTKDFNNKKDWLSIVQTLRRIKREQNASKDLEAKINAILKKTVGLVSRKQWFGQAASINMPDEIICYRANADHIVPRSFPLEFQYSLIKNGY